VPVLLSQSKAKLKFQIERGFKPLAWKQGKGDVQRVKDGPLLTESARRNYFLTLSLSEKKEKEKKEEDNKGIYNG
jgi:hypothetical protein